MKRENLICLAALVAACLIVSPLVHEMAHIAVLGMINGQYRSEISLYPQVSGSIRILSPLQAHEYFLVLATGIGASLFIGAVLLHRGRKRTSLISTSLGAGFLLNPSLAMLSKSDMAGLLSVMGIQGFSLIIGLSIMGFCAIELSRAAKS